MKAIYSTCLLFAFGLLAAQPDCTITDSLYNELDAQAAQIVLNEMVAAGIAMDGPVQIDSTRRTQYISALFAVHQLESSPERDTVIDQLRVRPFPFVSTREMFLAADTSFTWMANLRAGRPSGNRTLDSLMTHYALEVLRYCEWRSWDYDKVSLKSARPLNMSALAKVFTVAMPELDAAEPEQAFGDGDNIGIIPVVPDGWRIRYSVGSGDCPSGCIFRTNYDFEVTPECLKFEVVQTGGTATRQAELQPLTVFPVPFSDEIYLPATTFRYTFQIFDVTGRRVKAAESNQSGPITGLSDLVPGWYVLRVRDHMGVTYQARVVKQ